MVQERHDDAALPAHTVVVAVAGAGAGEGQGFVTVELLDARFDVVDPVVLVGRGGREPHPHAFLDVDLDPAEGVHQIDEPAHVHYGVVVDGDAQEHAGRVAEHHGPGIPAFGSQFGVMLRRFVEVADHLRVDVGAQRLGGCFAQRQTPRVAGDAEQSHGTLLQIDGGHHDGVGTCPPTTEAGIGADEKERETLVGAPL